MVALRRPCYGKVVSASFSPALFGGVRYDQATNSYTKGVDVLVLFEGGLAKLFKIRSMPRGQQLVEDSPSRTKKLFKRRTFKQVPRWYIYDSLGFSGIGSMFPNEKPILAKLEETSRKIIFATGGHLMVYEGISEHKLKKVLEGDSKWTYWDKQTIVEKAYHLSGGSPIERIFVRNSRQTELNLDTFYIICGSTPFSKTEEQPSRSKNGGYPEDSFICHFEPDQIDALDIKPIELLSSLSTLPYTDLTACEDYSSTSLYFGLDCSDYSLTYLKLYHSEEELYKPCTLMPKRRYPHPHAIPAHTTSVRIPWHSTHPIIATATAEGQIYISFPPLCNSSKLACRSSDSGFRRIKLKCTCPPTAFKKLARIPPATGGRITDMKISYRSPVLDSPRRNVVYLKDLEAMKGEIGILVLLIGTDRGRLEVCYFGPESKEVDTKRLWVARGSEIENKSDLGDFK
jgi:hypothetical protein